MSIDLSRASIVRCPHCQSFDVHRANKTGDHAGPSDQCGRCGMAWPAKPGSLTMEQHVGEGDLAGQEAAAEAKEAAAGAGPPGMPGGPVLANKY